MKPSDHDLRFFIHKESIELNYDNFFMFGINMDKYKWFYANQRARHEQNNQHNEI